MSALTKLFVVLLVVCSLLLVAAQVVFVSKSEEYKTALTKTKALRDEAQRSAESAKSAEEAATALRQAREVFFDKEIQKARGALDTQLAEVKKKEGELAEVKKALQLALATGTVQSATIDTTNKQLTDLRQQLTNEVARADKLSLQVGSLEERVVRGSADYKIVEARWKAALEDVARLTKQVADVQVGVTGTAIAQATPSITGVIKSVKDQNGIWYATISVGSAHQVKKGDQFKIISRGGQFMGLLTVDVVDLDNSWGRLEGKNPAQVEPDMIVKTQL